MANPYEPPTVDIGTVGVGQPPRSWRCAKWFAGVASLTSASAVVCIAIHSLSQLPPPGTPVCGLAATAPFVLIIVGAPLAAIASALVAGIAGAILDCIVYHCAATQAKAMANKNRPPFSSRSSSGL